MGCSFRIFVLLCYSLLSSHFLPTSQKNIGRLCDNILISNALAVSQQEEYVITRQMSLALFKHQGRRESEDTHIDEHCYSDRQDFCPNEKGTPAIISCLKGKIKLISLKCSTFLTDVKTGACNCEALTFCDDKLLIDDIFECLIDHKGYLSESCLISINSRKSNAAYNKSMTEARKATKYAIVLACCYLFILLLISIWTTYLVLMLQKIQSTLNKNYKPNIECITFPLSTSTVETIAEQPRPYMNIGFLRVSYWKYEFSKNNYFPFCKRRRHRRLRNLSGEFSCGLNAIL